MFLCFVVISIVYINGVSGVTCKKPESSCKCETDKGTVDLSPLDSGKPSVAGQVSISDVTFIL